MTIRSTGALRPDSLPVPRAAALSRFGRGFAAITAGALMVAACAVAAQPPALGHADELRGIKVRTVAGGYLSARYAGGVQDAMASHRFYEDVLRLDPGNTDLRRQSMMAALLVGNYLDATTHAEVIARLERDDPIAPLIVVISEIRTGRYEAAKKHLAALPANSALDIVGPIMSAWALQGLGDVDGAIAALARLGDNGGVRPLRLYHTALVAAASHEASLAVEAFAALRQSMNGGWMRAILAEGALFESLGQDAAARALYKAALADGNNRIVAATLERLDRGERAPMPVGTPAEGVAEAMFGIASLLAQEGANEPMLVYLRLALMARPEFPEAQVLLADTFDDVGDQVSAAELFRALSEDSPLRPVADVRRALLLADMERTDDALALLDARAAKGRDARVEAMAAKGDILRQGERFEEAVAAYDAAIEAIAERGEATAASHWSLYFSRGICNERLKRWEAAEADLQRALELRPDQPAVLNYLAYSWVEQGRHLAKAEAMLRKAVDDRPQDGYIVDSLGWVYFRQGRFEEAVVELEKAIELKPGDPTINDHLGDAYWAVGRRREAEFQWRTALALKPDPEQQDRIEAKLEKGLPPENLVPGSD
ncbi:tetratricopeptide repeat protein [Zavarzinia compransoris]|uniref:tetratricopeptide repeat protein n=1 Tax=Zavarzinia marina TaxID=2911065 RepID=UPI001F2492DC|nr:tetratricopeptide repeat protein [Zavarzinia marina]MCF4165121.1 tetratricopeptide repeat protein [Zavarzinia marina]